MKICLADLSQEALHRASEQLSAASVLTVPTDVSKMEEVQRLKGRVYADFGEVAVLMNNPDTSPGRYQRSSLHKPDALVDRGLPNQHLSRPLGRPYG